MMYGLRRPHRSLQVLSLVAPIRGWMIKPVIGPAMLRIGRSCGSAPMNKKSGLTAENTIPNPNELPKKPEGHHEDAQLGQGWLGFALSGQIDRCGGGLRGCH